MTTTLVATDLDGTVIFSDRSVGADRPADLQPVDPYAYMTATAGRHWTALAQAGAVLPVTTRSVEQYLRLRLPGPRPPLAVVCNGARLLVDGENDPAWERVVRQRLTGSAASFDEVFRQARAWGDEHPFKLVRAVEDFYVYFVAPAREPWLSEFALHARDWARRHGWRTTLQGRKFYLLPAVLDKAPAVAEVADRVGAGRVLAGGDSLLDEQMLRAADAGIFPAHGELHVTGFTAPNCRTTAGNGAAAGDEIVTWYAEQAGVGRR